MDTDLLYAGAEARVAKFTDWWRQNSRPGDEELP